METQEQAMIPTTATQRKNLPLDKAEIWKEVLAVQTRSQARNIGYKGVELFVDLCTKALKICAIYKIEKTRIDIEVSGGAVCKNYSYKAETTYIKAKGEYIWDYEQRKSVPSGGITIEVYRGEARKTSNGINTPHARMRIEANHPARQELIAAGLIQGNDLYARIPFPK